MDFWRRSVRISRRDKIKNNIIKQKMNVTRSLLDDIKTKPLPPGDNPIAIIIIIIIIIIINGMDMFQEWKREDYQKKL